MRALVIVVVSIFCTGCNFDTVIEEETAEHRSLIDTISPLNVTEDIYDYELRQFENGILSLCCNDMLAYPFAGNSKEEIEVYCLNSIDSSYEELINDSLFRRVKVSTHHSRFTLFSYGAEEYIEAGSYFKEPKVILYNGVHIGMEKQFFLNKFLGDLSDSLAIKINKVLVCPDERGEWYVNYLFDEDSLKEIKYSLDFR